MLFYFSGQETPENLLLDPFGATGSATNLSGATQNKSNKNSNSDAKLPSAEASVSFADFPNYLQLHICVMLESFLLVQCIVVWFRSMVLSAIFNNISAISWWSVLLIEVTRIPGENH
jgi:hypothetical protein